MNVYAIDEKDNLSQVQVDESVLRKTELENRFLRRLRIARFRNVPKPEEQQRVMQSEIYALTGRDDDQNNDANKDQNEKETSSAKCAEAAIASLSFAAKDPGQWGDSISVRITRSSKARTQAFEKLGDRKYKVKNAAGFNPGDIVAFVEGNNTEYNKVEKNQDNILTFANEFGADITDTELLPTKVIVTCELTVEVKYADTTEVYEKVSFNIEAANYIEKKTAKSDLITVSYSGDNEIGDLLESLSEDADDVITVEFSGGSNGSASDLSAADFIGTDNGAGNRTGIQDILNPKGVNLIRSFPGQGIRVWGARTASSDPSWKYVNIRRLFIFIEESIKANTNWAVFEPNDQALWTRVQRTISVFLNNMWRNGSLAGTSADEAFFVNIGRNTMSQDDIDNGRLVCVIGVAPVKPAEFVIFRITQNTGSAE